MKLHIVSSKFQMRYAAYNRDFNKYFFIFFTIKLIMKISMRTYHVIVSLNLKSIRIHACFFFFLNYILHKITIRHESEE